MKKSLVALAALAATSAFAQSSVTMYGVIDAGWGITKSANLDGTVTTKSTGVIDGSNAGSRIGFRGEEDLGGGLKAAFTVEQGFSPTSADGFNKRTAASGHQVDGASVYSTGNNRQSHVGLTGGFGTVRIGYQYTNSYDLVAFNGLSVGEFQGGNFQNGSVTGALSAHANGTRANAITFISPSMNGITVKAQYGQGAGRQKMENSADAGVNGYKANNNAYTSLMAQYAAGPVYAAVAYSKADLKTEMGTGDTLDAFGAALATQPTHATNTATRAQTAWNLGASYNFGVATVTYTAARVEGAPASSTSESKVETGQLSLKVPVGAMELVASTGGAKKTTGTTVNNDVKGSFFGLNYSLSKRTMAYAYTGSEKDKAVTTASSTLANYKDSKTVVGLRHSF